MSYWKSGAVLVLGMVWAVVFCVPADAADDLPDVLLLGDSISIGYTQDVAALLAGKANVRRPQQPGGRVVNCGPTERAIANLDEWLGETPWDVIHFNFGLHDLCYRHPDSTAQGHRDKAGGTLTATVEAYQANLTQIVARLRQTGARLIWAATTPVPDGDAGRIKGDEYRYNTAAEKIMHENHIPINDLHGYILGDLEQYQLPDGNVHFTPEGSRHLAERVAAFIEASLGPITVPLWPGAAPGSQGDAPQDHPSMAVYLPMQTPATGAAVLICPGGGYGHLAMDHEGGQIAAWLNSFGVAGMVLDYRHSGKGYAYPAPLDDAQRAMRLIRNHAAQWGIEANKIGVMGFSAGGHLASTVTTLFDQEFGKAGDAADALSSRPDFAILCYPVITMSESFMHRGSHNNLIGKDPAPELAQRMSTDRQVTPNTPPVFLIHAGDDGGVPVQNSLAFYEAMCRAKVPGELHIYEKGGHGFGLGRDKGTVSHWPDACRNWLLSVIAE